MAVVEERGTVEFGPFHVDLRTQRLHRQGVRIKLPRQSFLILQMLLSRPGEVVSREELGAALWPSDTFVDFEHGLNNAVNRIRVALNDSTETPRYIDTLPRLGYRFIGEVRTPVVSDQPVPASQPENGETSYAGASIAGARLSKRRWIWLTIATVVIVGIGVSLLAMAPELEQLARLRQLEGLSPVPLTTLPGMEGSPTFSPDGTQVAFVWYDPTYAPGFNLYAKAVGQEQPRRLTNNPPQSITLWAAWSPDGKYIAVCRVGLEGAAGKTSSAMYLVSPLGEPERQISSENCTTEFFRAGLSWSPDGQQLTFLSHPPDSKFGVVGLRVFSLSTMKAVSVETNCNEVLVPAFSPTGKFLAWACADDLSDVSIYLKPIKGNGITRLVRGIDGIGGLAWSGDGRRIIYSTGFAGGELWEVALDRPNRPYKLPFGHDVTDIAVSGAARRLVFKQNQINTNIWRIDITNPAPQAEKVVASSRVQVAPNYSPDGGRIAFESNRSGPNEVWICNADGSNATQLSSFGILVTGTPRWSPDGKLIVFDSRLGHEGNLYSVDPRGSVPQKINIDIRGNSMASWSHDGKWIYFVNGDDIGNPKIWKVPSQGGHAIQIASQTGKWPLESPDGNTVYFSSEGRLWQVAIDGSGEHEVPGSPSIGENEWTPSSSGIYFLSNGFNKNEIDFFDVASKQAHTVYVLKAPPPIWMGGMSVSPDGRWLLFAQLDDMSSDLMMVENWR
jgi:Tol biopolymer transport system component/DNA-binding winged helix-turn-helix (wHTH) protein